MIRFEPYYQPAAWGGRRLEEELGRRLPEGPIGESWELVELPERHSRVARGAHEGKLLGELWRAGALGGSAEGPFPFLLKWLDTSAWLSVQVHPDEQACAKAGKGRPKTEAWFVAHLEPKSRLLLGHYPGLDPATLRQAATGGTIPKWLYESTPRVGDMVLVRAGTLHAIGPGYLILEVQQPSDTTYRVYDWGRVGLDGKPRELHLDDALDAVRYDKPGAPPAQREQVVGPCFVMRGLRSGMEIDGARLRVFVAATGAATLSTARGEEILEYGDVVVAEPADGPVRVASGPVVFLSEPDQP